MTVALSTLEPGSRFVVPNEFWKHEAATACVFEVLDVKESCRHLDVIPATVTQRYSFNKLIRSLRDCFYADGNKVLVVCGGTLEVLTRDTQVIPVR